MTWPGEVNPWDCPEPHPSMDGPCMDMGQCPTCWTPIGYMRPPGETFGLHADDCSLPERHEGHCVGGGKGHRPDKVRGYWANMEADILAAQIRWDERNKQ